MEAPVFEEFDPANDCDCPGCVLWRRVLPHSPAGRATGHPAVRRTVVVAAASATALGAGHAAPALAGTPSAAPTALPAADEPQTPQGTKAPLHGPGGRPAGPVAAPEKLRETTRAEIIRRARTWVDAKVPYSMTAYWPDGYRQDCSGYVSMAWNLPRNEWTGSLGQYGERISKEELQPGDILLFHNPSDPQKGSHVTIFGGWTDYTHSYYIAYEQTRPHTRRQSTPYAYWSNSDRYLAYRYQGLTAGTPGAEPDAGESGTPDATGFPGRAYFGPGAHNKHVTRLGTLLVERGAGRFYRSGPGPRWTDADRRATRAFQLAQGWRGAEADGLPGPHTWRLLVSGRGNDVEAVTGGPAAPSSPRAPGFPGRAMFRPGADNDHVTRLGRQLVKKGFGAHYTSGPGRRWSEADRRNVEAFQRAQGWRGGAADGYPGPETWRRLFS
ncbi:peptidoglycan-binding protein [Streptomyces sp. DH24]|uniref:peptidoglycan-binding protein n=1 Tax=Streptomyces sp. DH24 TaxID=3040123 RepID=UPI00244161C4|nr:peptidoglycan-binding protein [Streptomyces sp. DH24]MDG9721054.1 peptidoglycan-binding protein [Streptomyces sp. DH24]